MLQVLGTIWALLFGVVLIMLGNGMQSTLMGVRGGIEGFSTFELSVVTSAYFAGFLVGSRTASVMIRKVGHVRVFAALGSFMSAGLIAFPLIAEPWAWTLLRVMLGFCLSGVYVSAESWLNNAATNRTRGTVLSAYMVAQTLGLVAAQGLVNVTDAAGFAPFALASILVSLSFAPILLSAQPIPVAERIKPLTLRQLYDQSPLGTVGILLLGGVFAAQLGMASVYGSTLGLSVARVTTFVAAIFTGSLLFQVPVGWLSDMIDRRKLILGVAAIGAVACATPWMLGPAYPILLASGFVMGGMASPLYSLLVAYTNDYLDVDDMPAASGGLIFIYGLGAIVGPLATGQLMEIAGPEGFWAFLGLLFAAIAVYCAWRMTRREAPSVEESGSYVNLSPTASQVAVGAAQEWGYEQAAEDTADDDPDAERK
ncbi:Predicted arabinose efflux permease, MFS family [Tranquillimonas rosea]|uniref:Predicted arabinose efflux permease, MFS family n=1 Tax=Tranquillimonas rosea TaxID=641238 RepID=A0A1H9WRE1_9RHOB|nr:MFS transporter [Tranquillimonas rosea]SES36349.1 Predicted arabinose efflux permease, MFS family [Tranquillimonas rosea]